MADEPTAEDPHVAVRRKVCGEMYAESRISKLRRVDWKDAARRLERCGNLRILGAGVRSRQTTGCGAQPYKMRQVAK